MNTYKIKSLFYIQEKIFRFYMHYKNHVARNYLSIQIKFSCILMLS